MSRYNIPVSWTVDLTVGVEADCLEDAVEEIIGSQVKDEDAVFRPGSFVVHEEDAMIEVRACHRSEK